MARALRNDGEEIIQESVVVPPSEGVRSEGGRDETGPAESRESRAVP